MKIIIDLFDCDTRIYSMMFISLLRVENLILFIQFDDISCDYKLSFFAKASTRKIHHE